MSNGVKGPTTTHATVPIQQVDGRPMNTQVEVSLPPQVGGGFNESSGFQTVSGVDGTHNKSTTSATPPVSTGSTDENFGQSRSELAHAFNTLRKSLRFMNHKGNPNAQQASEAELKEALATIAKETGVKLDTSKGTPTDLLTQLAKQLGVPTGTTAPTTAPTTGAVAPNGNPGIVPPSTGTSTATAPTTTATAPTAASTSTVDPMQIFQSIVQKVLGSLH